MIDEHLMFPKKSNKMIKLYFCILITFTHRRSSSVSQWHLAFRICQLCTKRLPLWQSANASHVHKLFSYIWLRLRKYALIKLSMQVMWTNQHVKSKMTKGALWKRFSPVKSFMILSYFIPLLVRITLITSLWQVLRRLI